MEGRGVIRGGATVRRRLPLGMCRVQDLKLPGLRRRNQRSSRRRVTSRIAIFLRKHRSRVRMDERLQHPNLPEVLLRGRDRPAVAVTMNLALVVPGWRPCSR
uniref:(northern house mosquito) hypothetical protein n=1 Tax=Culex pipiens TaxID=7175 RepID=A0A8D8A5Y7_CULPI